MLLLDLMRLVVHLASSRVTVALTQMNYQLYLGMHAHQGVRQASGLWRNVSTSC